MARLSAIFLLSTFFLYHIGYYALYLGTSYYIESVWENKLEKGYQDNTGFQVKAVPIALPYAFNQETYQNVSRQVLIEGKFYRVVKQKYAKDTLHIVYVNDQKTEILNESLKKWAAAFTPQSTSKNGGKLVLNDLIKNYLPGLFSINFESRCCPRLYSSFLLPFLEHVFIFVPVPPPEFV